MPVLKDVLPGLVEDDEYRQTTAFKYRNERIAAIRLASGAPCSSHSELFAPWPGTETNVEEWYLLKNGQAVGKRLNDQGVYEFPVINSHSPLS